MKTMCPPGYHRSGFVATHALRYLMYSYTLLVPMSQRVLNKLSKEHNAQVYPRIMCPSAWVAHCEDNWEGTLFHDCIYIMPILLLWDLSTLCRRSFMATYISYIFSIYFYIYFLSPLFDLPLNTPELKIILEGVLWWKIYVK